MHFKPVPTIANVLRQTASRCASSMWLALGAALIAVMAMSGCGEQPPPAPVAVPKNDQPSIYATSLLEGCHQSLRNGKVVTSAAEGRSVMRIAEMDCRNFLKEFSQEPRRQQVEDLLREVMDWQRRFQRAEAIESAMERNDYERAHELLRQAWDDFPSEFAERVNAALNAQEDKFNAQWLAWTLDVDGYDRGKCTVTALVAKMQDVKSWAQQNGFIEVVAFRESPEWIAIDHYDRNLRAFGTRVFYQDIATCRARRGE